jgi:hypothetical protein
MRRFSFAMVVLLFTMAGCKGSLEDIPKSVAVGIVTVALADAPGGVHNTSPTAYFVDASNVNLPNSAVSADTCAQLPFPGISSPTPLPQLDAGTPVIFATPNDTVQLTATAPDVNGYVFYRLPGHDSIAVRPGLTSTVTIPGSSNGFHAFSYQFTNADSLALEPIDATRADSTDDLTLNWNPQLGKTASVVVQLEWASSGSSPDTQIFCQFTDNGSHAVEKRLANLWRAGTGKHVHAYRFLTSITNDGTDQLDVVSQYSTDSTHIINP